MRKAPRKRVLNLGRLDERGLSRLTEPDKPRPKIGPESAITTPSIEDWRTDNGDALGRSRRHPKR